ncbi:MAG TPA: CocE/NonD family hydrolase [Gemmatimonadaceae bacterium]|nr:CocE/NonD family hydrolase [Gemmatimonadaceae bacterium]
MPRPLQLFLALTLVATSVVRSLPAQDVAEYERRELRIPMRDGVTLFAVALVPKRATTPLPILLIRTPFNAARELGSAALPVSLRELGQDGYIFVSEDVRGRFGSQGTFVSLRPQRDPRDPRGVDESTDAWDTIDWLVRSLPNNNGKVGVLGVSYRGWLAALAGLGAHPALKAISPQGLVADAWLGDDFFHQGAFRQTQGVAYAAYVEGSAGLTIPDYDQFDFYRRYLTLNALAKATGVASLPSWVGFRAHPSYDAYWQARALQNVYRKAEVPTLVVGGWWDEEDLLGPQLAYRTLERADAERRNFLVMGPWSHGSWSRPGGDSLGSIGFGSKSADYFRSSIQRPWFAHYLHGNGDGRFPEAQVFESGANEWRQFEVWPPKEAKLRQLYLRENGRLAFDPPPASNGVRQATTDPLHSSAFDAFVSDPAHPVPYIPRPDDGEGWNTWLVQDQRFVDNRPDVLTWVSDPLAEDLTIAGDVVAHLFASTTGTDADWVVKLIDVYPESVADAPRMGGYQLIVNADILRGRYWKGFARATPIPANTVTPFAVDLHGQLYRFRKGHRLMVQVQSTWFPLYDRNPQQFVPNVFDARPVDFRAQTHRVWHTATHPSHLSVAVMP